MLLHFVKSPEGTTAVHSCKTHTGVLHSCGEWQPEETGTPYLTCDTCKCLYSSGCGIPLWREEGKKPFFFSREGGREGGALWSRNCVKSYCTSTHWQKLRVDFLPTSGGDGDTHTHREREGKLLLLLRLSWGRDLLVRSELVRPAVETLCFLPVLRTVTYTAGVRSEGRAALIYFLFLFIFLYRFCCLYRWHMVLYVQCVQQSLIVCMCHYSNT